MNSPAHDELLRHASALRRLAVALVGSQDADDLVQDAVVATLQRPPANSGSWFPWLSGMLRYMAGKRRRGEQRRRWREEVVADAAADSAAAPSALDVAAQRAAITELHQRLLAVPEPYQSTLLLRYFQDLSPQQIAERTATPLATVKSQLQRGLKLLRRRYDGDRGSDWRAGLFAALGIEQPAAAVAATAAGAGIVMGIKGWSSLLAVLLLAAIWVSTLRPGTPETTPTASTPPPSPALAAPLDEEALIRRAVDVTTTAAAALEAPAASRSVRTRGRCIDEANAPLADVAIEVAVSAPPHNRRESVQQLRSAADGTFAFELALPPQGDVSIDFRAAGRIGMSGSWEGGLVDDVGDVMLPRGVQVHGRIVDARGLPQSGVRVRASRLRIEAGPLRADIDWSDRISDADGTFAFGGRFPIGPFALLCTNRQLLSPTPAQWELSSANDSHLCELVVAPAPPPCRGVVVDEAGQPIASAHVQMDGHGASTDERGRFVVEQDPRRRDATSEVAASADGFEHAKVSWTRDDPGELRLVLARSPGLQLHVVDGRSGTPVERFAVVLAQRRLWHSMEADAPVRSWPGGVAWLPAERGEWHVLVRAEDAGLAPSPWRQIVLGDAPVGVVRIVLAPTRERRLVVTDGQRPLAGVSVELLDALGESLRRDTLTTPLELCNFSGPPTAFVLQAGTTDADGALLLRGPVGDLALRLSGGGCPLQLVDHVRLDIAEDLRVQAPRGASWRGRLAPTEVVRDLLAPPAASDRPLGLMLWNEQGSLRRFNEAPFPLAADGSFELRDLPPGQWRLTVLTYTRYEAAVVDLAAGQELEQDVDVQALAVADVELHVRLDGQLLRDGNIVAIGMHAGTGGRPFRTQSQGTLGDGGRFALRTAVGELEVTIDPIGGKPVVALVAVTRPGPQRIDLDLQLGPLQLSLLAPDGAPAAQLECRLAASNALCHSITDEHGVLRFERAIAGRYEVRVRPAALRDHNAQRAFAAQFGETALTDAWLSVGAVDVVAGTAAAAPTSLRLPPSWTTWQR